MASTNLHKKFLLKKSVLLVKTVNLSLSKTALLVGFVFAIFGAIAPLLIPNEFMPANVRLAHGFETGISNFLYGIVLVYLFGKRKTNTGQYSRVESIVFF